MKKIFVTCFALAMLLLGSMSTYAVDWSTYSFLGDGAGGGKYTDKYKVETVDGLSVINIQQPGFATEAGIYVNVPAGIDSVSVASAIQGAGAVLYLSAFTAQETEVTIAYAGGSAVFHVYYADGTTSGGSEGDGEGDDKKPSEPTTAADPTAAPAAPTYPADQVKAVYSATYSADCGFGEWGSGTTCTQETYGKKYVFGNTYFGLIDFALNCAKMEKLHLDIYPITDGTVRIVPIWGGTEVGITTQTLVAGQWNSIDIALTDFTGVTDWTNIYQIKIDNATMKTIWLNNVYFYTTVAPTADTEAPTDLTATLTDASYFSANISAKATDNSGVVVFKVLNDSIELTSKTAVSATETTITISGLNAGTEYNLTVAAYDETGNKAATDVTVNLTTLAAPAPAPAPTVAAEKVLSIYSDAYTAGATHNIGQWGQSTVVTEGNLAENDKAYLCTNSNYLGLELNGSTTVGDLTTKNYIHMDIYVAEAGSIQFTPIWGSELLQTYTLVAGWNALDIDMVKTFTGIDLTNIIQVKFANMPATCFIDNIYFYEPEEQTAIVNIYEDAVKTEKVIENGQLIIIREGARYNAMGQAL